MKKYRKVIVEIKSFYGSMQSYELASGKPRTSYLKQLAIYMDATNLNKGILLYMDRGTGQMFQFNLERAEGLMFVCTSANKDGYAVVTQFDLSEDYKRFAKIWNDYIVPDIEPDSDYIYKYPIEQIDWSTLSKPKITDARMGRAVIGDWQPKYSGFKDLLVAREAKKYGLTFDEYIGYSADEIARIKELTKGFSTKTK